MKKLKCWRKIKSIKGFAWNRSGEKGDYPYLYAGRGYYNTAEKDWKKRYPFKVGLVNYTSERVIKDNITLKSKALSFAQKYMEEHDTC